MLFTYPMATFIFPLTLGTLTLRVWLNNWDSYIGLNDTKLRIRFLKAPFD